VDFEHDQMLLPAGPIDASGTKRLAADRKIEETPMQQHVLIDVKIEILAFRVEASDHQGPRPLSSMSGLDPYRVNCGPEARGASGSRSLAVTTSRKTYPVESSGCPGVAIIRCASHSTLARSMLPASTVLCLSPILTVPP